MENFEFFIVQSLIEIEKIFFYEMSSITVLHNGVNIDDSNGMEAPRDGHGPNLVPLSLLLVILQHILEVMEGVAILVPSPCIALCNELY